MANLKKLLLIMLLGGVLGACSLPPERLVTRKDLAGSGLYRSYTIAESPEEILNALNAEGEVVLSAMKGKYPVYVKILATADGIIVSSYDR